MFIRFSTDAYENITYFSSVGTQLIKLMGHSGTVPGAIKSIDLPEALENLQKGLNQQPQTTSIDKEDEREPEISLVKRAVPLINLLQAAIKKECDVLWAAANSPG